MIREHPCTYRVGWVPSPHEHSNVDIPVEDEHDRMANHDFQHPDVDREQQDVQGGDAVELPERRGGGGRGCGGSGAEERVAKGAHEHPVAVEEDGDVEEVAGELGAAGVLAAALEEGEGRLGERVGNL